MHMCVVLNVMSINYLSEMLCNKSLKINHTNIMHKVIKINHDEKGRRPATRCPALARMSPLCIYLYVLIHPLPSFFIYTYVLIHI